MPFLMDPSSGRFRNGREWHQSLGDVPLERIIFSPWPGTATEADLLRVVESGDCLCELVDGTLVEKPMGLAEAIIAANLISYLGHYVLTRKLGTVSGADSTLRMASSGRIRLPDVSFFSADRSPPPGVKVPTLAPDLATEVLSESNTEKEIELKLLDYFRSGTRLAWVIHPDTRIVDVYHSPQAPDLHVPAEGKLSGENVVPGFEVLVEDLFQNVVGR